MKMSAASCRLMVPSCICSARMDSTKWALDTAALSGCVARAAYQLCAVILLEFFKSFLQRQKMTWLQVKYPVYGKKFVWSNMVFLPTLLRQCFKSEN